LLMEGSATNGSVNALAFDIDHQDGIVGIKLSYCGLPNFNYSTYPTVNVGTYGMTVVDWTDDSGCRLLLQQNITGLLLTEWRTF